MSDPVADLVAGDELLNVSDDDGIGRERNANEVMQEVEFRVKPGSSLQVSAGNVPDTA